MTVPDLRVVAELCELVLAARRLGATMRVVDPDPDLRALIELVGVDDVLLDPAPVAPVRGPLP